jgi:hypothetical protein
VASFLARLGGLGSNPPAANAKTALTATTATHAGSADRATGGTTAGNATTVGGYAPNGLARVAPASANNLAGGRTFTTRQAAPITAPAAGFLLVLATATAHAPLGCPCSPYARPRLASSTTSPIQGVTMADNTYSPLAIAEVFPAAAGTQTLTLEAAPFPTNLAFVVNNATVAVLFVPFGPTGAATLDLP